MNPWLIPALAFTGAAALVGLVLYLVSARAWRIGRRIETIERDGAEEKKGKAQSERRDLFPALSTLLERGNRKGSLERELERAGLAWRPSEFTVAWLAATAGLAAVGWLSYGLLGALAGVALASGICVAALKALAARRRRQFEQQLPDALMLISSSLRSGYGILRAMQAVRDEMKPPIAPEFGKVLDETAVGVPVPEALTHLVERVPLHDLDIAVTAILIQLDVGGNLAEVMEIVASTVRERQRIRAEVDTLTAEGRLSGVILFVLPLVMAGVLTVLNRSYMTALFSTSLGHILIGAALVLQVLGGLVIIRMLRLDF